MSKASVIARRLAPYQPSRENPSSSKHNVLLTTELLSGFISCCIITLRFFIPSSPAGAGAFRMPTPQSSEDIVATPSLHSSCPPEDDRSSWRSVDMEDRPVDENLPPSEVLQQSSTPTSDSRTPGSTDTHIEGQHQTKRMDIDEEVSAPDMLSPMSAEAEKPHDESDLQPLTRADLGSCSPSMGYDFSNIRVSMRSRKSCSQLV